MRFFYPIESLSLNTKIVYVMVYFMLTILLSFALYRLYERPLMNLRDAPRIKRFFRVD
jgi:peptidoglycan/LPS O-acetylase OafA/YrhL